MVVNTLATFHIIGKRMVSTREGAFDDYGRLHDEVARDGVMIG